MKRILLVPVIMLLALAGYSQYNNSWIDFSKTYYKFSLANDTLCHLTRAQLATVGLENTPVQNFQLWRNGKEVRLYTSVTSGPLGPSDYIEFWGEMNDGKPDKYLYKDTLTQLCDRYSLETDTAMYFLTVNPTGNNLRYVQSANPVVGTLLTPDAYFMRRIENHYKDMINRGLARPIIEYVYSSSYDTGEGWSSGEVFPCCALSKVLTNINKYTAGPPNSVTFTIGASGNALYSRELVAKFFNTEVLKVGMPFFDYYKDTVRNLPLSVLANNSNLAVSINGNSTNPNDRIAVACFTVTYPATFNFNNESNFYFELGPNAAGNYLVIDNFNNSGVPPILYDMTNGRRYLGNIDVAGKVRFVLPPSSDPIRKFNLISDAPSNFFSISGLTSKTFTNYANTSLQGDYIIISNPVLYNNGSGVNNVELYRQYRSSTVGGGYNGKVYDVNELTDQFGYGIKKNPAAIRDFIMYAYNTFSVKPKYVFLIGHGLSYMDYTTRQSDPAANQLNLIQTFGWPVSDVLLASKPGEVGPVVPIGRLGAINGNEVGAYLEKMKEFEQVQTSPSQTVGDKAWMKNILHTIGGANEDETKDFTNYMLGYEKIAEDTLLGADVHTFAKSTVAAIEQQQSQAITNLFHEGLGYIKYFGHSSANELAINLNYPEAYDNPGKYPFMHVSGCTVGNFFTYNPARPDGAYANMSLSEKYLFLSHKGAIGFLGSTHFGIAPFLNFYNSSLYHDFSYNLYGQSIGQQIQHTIQTLGSAPNLDFYTRMHLEEMTLHGDPALKLSVYPKPDYVIEDQLVKFTPDIISVADASFTVDIKMMNIGKAINDSIRVTVKQRLPDNSIKSLYDKKIEGIKYMDSIKLTVPINPVTDKGRNELIIMLDDGDKIPEMSETNNSLVKVFYIFEDELRPIYPYNFSIVNQQNISYYASTANPIGGQRQYVMEIDTTELFNSPLKKSYTANGTGGVIQFTPNNITFVDSTVYYWRTATVPSGTADYIWNDFSFIYLKNSSSGYNQSHYYQHLKNSYTNMSLKPDRVFHYDPLPHNIVSVNGTWPVSATQAQDIQTVIDGFVFQTNYSSWYLPPYNPALLVNIYTNGLASPIENTHTGYHNLSINYNYSAQTKYNFEFYHNTKAERQKLMDFLDSIPNGTYVSIKNISWTPYSSGTNITNWKADGPTGQTLYDKLKGLGFSKIDSFYTERAWVFFYQKGVAPNSAIPAQIVGKDMTEKVTLNVDFTGLNYNARITSPLYGPVAKWTALHWRGNSLDADTSKDYKFVEVYGVKTDGTKDLLTTVTNARDTTLAFIDKNIYPYVQLSMPNVDSIYATPSQLKYWRVNADFIPEGTLAPNILFNMKDTAEQGEKIDFKLAFKNISSVGFDSMMKINLTVYDQNNVQHPAIIPKGKKLIAGDTLVISYQIDTRNLAGKNVLFVEVNPANDQPEQYHFNNILYKDFFVKADVYNPLLDVTFDGVHILNKDIVAAKPHIVVDLKDENRFMALADTALLKVQVRFPDNSIHDYYFGDIMQFTPANLATGNNTAKIDFKPIFTEDGEYELIVSGKDVVGNTAGVLNYHVIFTVISKAMISNLLNYPNPFTTSTAFVFTITGEEVPQNLRIQVLTISGKIVKEITKDELGPIHVGRNITEYKWDGTDTYGQKLANGVYLYRVITNLNGKSLEKYKADGDKTDKYFNKGYGKMVILR